LPLKIRQPFGIDARNSTFGGGQSAFHLNCSEARPRPSDITYSIQKEFPMLSILRIKNYLTRPALAFAVATLPVLSSIANAADLIVIVGNVQQDTGQIMLGLFANDPADFPKSITKGISALAAERDAQGKLRMVFSDLAPGRYAATAYQDINGDGKLTTNLMKLPTEPYGFSNNARGAFGPPPFKDAAVTLGEENLTIEIQIK
jgi:uncharacterized protein (DUF2141 family)